MKLPFRPNILAMQGYTPGEQPPAGVKVIKLNTNENPYPPSPRVLEAIRAELDAGRALGERLRLYPDPRATELVTAAAETTGVPAAQILAGNGSDELLSVLVRAFLGPDDTVAFPYPTYVLYETLARLQAARIVAFDFDDAFRLPRELFGADARLVFVASPNSPSGTVYGVDQLRELAASLRGGVLVVDEAYAGFAGQSVIELIEELPNVVVVRTLSKSHALAGMRVGLLFSSAELVAELTKVRDSYSLDRLAIVAAAAALRDAAYTEEIVGTIATSRDHLIEGLRRLGLSPLPSCANFVFVRCGGADHAAHLYAELGRRGILVRYFPMRLLDDGLRITVGTPAEIHALLDELEDVLRSP